MNFCNVVLTVVRYGLIFFGLALIINLYSRAMAFEKDFIPDDPEKEALNQNIIEMQDMVSEIYKSQFDDIHVNDNKFEN